MARHLLLAGLAALLAADPAGAFSLYPPLPALPGALAEAARWSSVSGLDDGIQVSIEQNFTTNLGALPSDQPFVEQAVRDALAMWESPVLAFHPTFEDPTATPGPTLGSEIDVFAVPGSHPVFAGNSFFGITVTSQYDSPSRPLTNGQSAPGAVIDGADVYLNRDMLLGFLLAFPSLTYEQRRALLTRLLAHEFGHALGLGHSNANDPYGPTAYWDLDALPTNPIVIDAVDPFADFTISALRDDAAILSNRPCGEPFVAPCPALFDNFLHADDAGGRDVLYPAVLPVAPGAVVTSGPLYVVVSDPASGATDRLLAGPPLAIGDGVAVDAAGDVLVADSGGGAILRIDAETQVVTTVASGGDLLLPNRLAVAPEGRIYVADVGNGGRIVAVSPGTGATALLASLPVFDIAIDRTGTELYVTSDDRIVRVLTSNGEQKVLASGGLMDANVGIALEADGSLLVMTDVDGSFVDRLVRVSSNGTTQTVVHESAGGDPGYYDLALDADGNAIVPAVGLGAVVRIDVGTGVAAPVDSLELPFGVAAVLPVCADGLDNDHDGKWDHAGADADPGCTGAADDAETQAGVACDDGLDNDGDGLVDEAQDPGCQSLASTLENPKCDNDLDDDGDGKIDWNGPGPPDPQCAQPYQNGEASCGLGAELALALPLLGAGLRRRRRRSLQQRWTRTGRRE